VKENKNMKFRVEARQTNYGYFEIEADSVEQAQEYLADMIEDDFIREHAEWYVEDEIEIVGLR
jgi:hypothetical protein